MTNHAIAPNDVVFLVLSDMTLTWFVDMIVSISKFGSVFQVPLTFVYLWHYIYILDFY